MIGKQDLLLFGWLGYTEVNSDFENSKTLAKIVVTVGDFEVIWKNTFYRYITEQ